MRIINSILLLVFLLPLSLRAELKDSVLYSPEFKFNDGFYLSFTMVKNNTPIPAARIVTDLNRNSADFYTKLLENKTFTFFDSNGVRQEIPMNKLWGFSRNGVLYIKLSEGFHRVTIIGGICHFVATVVSYENRYYDPYYSNPYYYRYGNPYYPYSTGRNTRTQEIKQYLIDFETGKLYEYNVQSVEILLMKDPELYDEYMGLRKKKKKQLKFFYIRKFNERNPVYIPVN